MNSIFGSVAPWKSSPFLGAETAPNRYEEFKQRILRLPTASAGNLMDSLNACGQLAANEEAWYKENRGAIANPWKARAYECFEDVRRRVESAEQAQVTQEAIRAAKVSTSSAPPSVSVELPGPSVEAQKKSNVLPAIAAVAGVGVLLSLLR